MTIQTKEQKIGDVTVKELIQLDVDKKYIIRVAEATLADLDMFRQGLEALGLKQENILLIRNDDMDIVEVNDEKPVKDVSEEKAVEGKFYNRTVLDNDVKEGPAIHMENKL